MFYVNVECWLCPICEATYNSKEEAEDCLRTCQSVTNRIMKRICKVNAEQVIGKCVTCDNMDDREQTKIDCPYHTVRQGRNGCESWKPTRENWSLRVACGQQVMANP